MLLGGLAKRSGRDPRVLVDSSSGDDAGVFVWGDAALVATVDVITPLCDDPHRFGRIAAANALSDVWAMGGEPLFALDICCFPAMPEGVGGAIVDGAVAAFEEVGAVLLGGHSVTDPELKFGLAVIGRVDPQRILTLAGAEPGQRLILTKPLGTGVIINAFKADRLDAAGFESTLVEMERLNAKASRIALEHGATAATDVTGFGLAGHAWNIARQSGVKLRIEVGRLPVHDGFGELVRKGITTGCTAKLRQEMEPHVTPCRALDEIEAELIVDPQTSGGLLLALPAAQAEACLSALIASGHRAAPIGDVVAGSPGIELV